MKYVGVNYVISIVLLCALVLTGMTGYIQSQLELRKFVPHMYFAYTTLALAAVHAGLNIAKVWRYYVRKRRPSSAKAS